MIGVLIVYPCSIPPIPVPFFTSTPRLPKRPPMSQVGKVLSVKIQLHPKNTLILALVLVVPATVAAQNAGNATELTTATVNTPGDGFLSLRSEPSTRRGSRLRKIPHGTQVQLAECTTEADSGSWCRTTYSGATGWVFERYLVRTPAVLPAGKFVTHDDGSKSSSATNSTGNGEAAARSAKSSNGDARHQTSETEEEVRTVPTSIEIIKSALPYADLSAHIYQCADRCDVFDGAAGPWVPQFDSRDMYEQRDPMGFHAVAFINPEDEVAVVYEGTSSRTDWKDWATNIAQANPYWTPSQYSAAIDFATAAEKLYCSGTVDCNSRIIYTGHSLGGGLAQYAAIKLGRRAYTFNAAGLWDSTAGDLDTTTAATAEITHFRSKGFKFGFRLGTDFVPYTGVQFAEKTIDVPVELPIWAWDTVTLEVVTHNMDRLRDAMFAMGTVEGDFSVSTQYGMLAQEKTIEADGCKHHTRVPADRIVWTGGCTRGNVSGTGEMTYFREGLAFLIVKVGPDSDVKMSDGRMVWARKPPYSIADINRRKSASSNWVEVKDAGGANLHINESIARIADMVRTDERVLESLDGSSKDILITVYKKNGFEEFSIDATSGAVRSFHNNENSIMQNRLRALNAEVLASREQEAKEGEKAKIAEMRLTAEQEWPKRWEELMESDEPWPNTADQLRHNLGAAMLSLKKGRPIIVEVQEVGFSDDAAIVSTYQTFTDIYEGIPAGEFTWSDWFDKVNAVSDQRGYQIRCRMQPEALSILKVGQGFVVDALLTNLQGEHIALACTNPRPHSDGFEPDGD